MQIIYIVASNKLASAVSLKFKDNWPEAHSFNTNGPTPLIWILEFQGSKWIYIQVVAVGSSAQKLHWIFRK